MHDSRYEQFEISPETIEREVRPEREREREREGGEGERERERGIEIYREREGEGEGEREIKGELLYGIDNIHPAASCMRNLHKFTNVTLNVTSTLYREYRLSF